MNKRQRLLSSAAAATLGLAGLIGAAAPANAATIGPVEITACNNSTNLPVQFGPTFPFTFSFAEVDVNDTITFVNNSSVTITVSEVTAGTVSPTPTTIAPTAGTTATFTVNGAGDLDFLGAGCNLTATFELILNSGPTPSPTPDASSSSSAAPQTFELSLIPTDGTTCTNSSESGRAGTWMTLPAANDCAPPATKPGATLLGWATNPNFPVEIAQRQVDNGWGAYETFNDEGQLTGVFIPAGKPTFLSGSGQLYPIWSQ